MALQNRNIELGMSIIVPLRNENHIEYSVNHVSNCRQFMISNKIEKEIMTYISHYTVCLRQALHF